MGILLVIAAFRCLHDIRSPASGFLHHDCQDQFHILAHAILSGNPFYRRPVSQHLLGYIGCRNPRSGGAEKELQILRISFSQLFLFVRQMEHIVCKIGITGIFHNIIVACKCNCFGLRCSGSVSGICIRAATSISGLAFCTYVNLNFHGNSLR